MIWQKFLSYINIFSKNKSSRTSNVSLKMMHGINRISIVMFLIAIIVMIVRYLA